MANSMNTPDLLEKTPLTKFIEHKEVVICDGLLTGTFGTVGGHKGTSVAVCIPDYAGHDCDGMCPDGGTYEPEYALLEVTNENKEAIKLLVSHVEALDSAIGETQV